MESPKRVKKSIKILVLGICIIGATVFLWLVSNNKTYIDATTHQPERYTELYFTKPNSLPKVVVPGKSMQILSTIHNVEAKNMSYTFAIELTDSLGHTQILKEQSISIQNGQTIHQVNVVTLPKFSGKAELSVVLFHQPEAIHFWVAAAS